MQNIICAHMPGANLQRSNWPDFSECMIEDVEERDGERESPREEDETIDPATKARFCCGVVDWRASCGCGAPWPGAGRWALRAGGSIHSTHEKACVYTVGVDPSD